MLNGYGPRKLQAQGSSFDDPRSGSSEPSANRLIEELAGLLKEQPQPEVQDFTRGRAHFEGRETSPAGAAYSSADRDEDLSVPIPSSWVDQPAPKSGSGWLSEQVRAALLGFGVGLVIVLPMVLLLTGQLGQFSFESSKGTETGRSTAAASVVAVEPKPGMAIARLPVKSEVVKAEPALQALGAAPWNAPPSNLERATTPANAAERQTGSLPPVAVPQPPEVPAAEPAATQQVSVPPAPAPDLSAALLLEGRMLIDNGDVSSGRAVLLRAIEAQPVKPDALFALAETYDPNMLAAWGARAVTADVQRARALYARALDSGVEKARARLDGLN